MIFLQYFTYFTFILPLIVYLFFFKRNNYTLSRVIFVYLIYTVLNEIFLIILKLNSWDPQNSISPILYALYTIFEFIFFGFYLYKIIKYKNFKISLWITSILFLLIAFVNLYQIIFSKIRSQLIDSIPVSTSAILLIIFSILFLFQEIQTPKIGFIYSSPKFWIVVGIMIYFSGTFFYFLQYSDLSNTDQDNYWTINLLCIILKNIFFSISFLLPIEMDKTKEYDDALPFAN